MACTGAVVCTQAVAATRLESLQRSRMGSGQDSVAGSMLLRAATMGPGQCLGAESFLGNGKAPLAEHISDGLRSALGAS